MSRLALHRHLARLLCIGQALTREIAARQRFENEDTVRMVRPDRHAQTNVDVAQVALLDAQEIPFEPSGVGDSAELLAAFQMPFGIRNAVKPASSPRRQEPGGGVIGLALQMAIQSGRGGHEVVALQCVLGFAPISGVWR
jgi:hypothetical protein